MERELPLPEFTEEEIANFPHKNVIVRALGMKETVAVDILREEPQVGDVFLLCSDGLNSMLTDEEIWQTLSENRSDPERACRALVDSANAKGGDDNITVIVYRLNGTPD